MRKALSYAAGPIRCQGNQILAEILQSAFQAAQKHEADALTHGLHSYAGRMHWAIAQTLIKELSAPNRKILDPFCGSGTVNVEAAIAGRSSIGADINPLALRIAQ